MFYKKTIALILCSFCVTFLLTGCFSKKINQDNKTDLDTVNKEVAKQAFEKPKVTEKKYDLYSSNSYDLPLFSIVEISKAPLKIKTSIDKILEDSQGFYLLKYDNNKIMAILQNPVEMTNVYQRHNLQIIEIDSEGKIIYHNAGYSGEDGEIFDSTSSNKDLWLFDETIEPFRPLKHIAYNEKGKIKFIEIWNYNDDEPIKYQMKDANKKIVSMLKETQDSDYNLRREHIFYDNDGIIKMSLTINYDGANISRVNFYNSHDSIDSISVFTEYIEGNRVKELIYDENFVLKYTVNANYQNDERKKIEVLDSENKKLISISS